VSVDKYNVCETVSCHPWKIFENINAKSCILVASGLKSGLLQGANSASWHYTDHTGCYQTTPGETIPGITRPRQVLRWQNKCMTQ